MGTPDASRVLAEVEALQSKQISILQLSEPITSALHLADQTGTTARTSDVSNTSLGAPTPASLAADLAHYRELFSKLRFSYVEQVTKEKFIRAIVGEPPQMFNAAEILALEQSNATDKAQLKALKADVAARVEALEETGRNLARRWVCVAQQTVQLRELPGRIEQLEESIAALRAAGHGDVEGGREMNLPLEKTLDLVEQRRRKVAELDKQIESLNATLPRKRKESERLAAELATLETRRANTTAAAREARKRKEARLGGAEDDLEIRGKWLRAEEVVLKRMLEV